MFQILAALLLSMSMSAVAHGSFDPRNAGIDQLRAALDAGRITSEQLVQYYLERIERLDRRGPRINALITLNPDALNRARQLDRQSKTAHRAMLYGIPFVAKDNYDTAGIETSGGSAALKHSVPSANAFVVQKLLDQGAILIGKANMSELAASYGRLGYSSAGGLTLNPYNTARDASGSSSGSAAAVAADFATFALGTDTGGSVRAPASVTGLAGLRPTLGLTSRGGVIPLSLSFDTTGVLTRSVKDLAIVLDAIAGPDPQDAATLRQPALRGTYAESVVAPSLRGTRLGVVTNFRGGNPEVDGLEKAALGRLASLGAVLVPLALPASFENLWAAFMGAVSEAEFKPQFERYLHTLAPSQPRTLRQVIAFSEAREVAGSATPINPARLQALRAADETVLTDSPAYIRMLTQDIPAVRQQLRSLMKAKDLHGLVFATMSCPATPRFDRADPSYVCRSRDPYGASYVAAAAGFPEITVPAGRISGNMPVGYSFMGLPFSEARLINFASAFEAAGPRLEPPPL